jgi:hypothetical protein
VVAASSSVERVRSEPNREYPSAGVFPKGVRYLRPDEFALWDEFVDASPQGSLFCHSWWLRAIGGDTRVLAHFKDGHLAGGIPLHFEKQWRLTVCRMPQLTFAWGVLLPRPQGKRAHTATEEMATLRALANALTTHQVWIQSFSPAFDNWLPFYWQGFGQTTRFTHRINLQNLDEIWQGISKQRRGCIRSVERSGITIVPSGPEQVYELEEQTFRRQGMKMPHARKYLERLYVAAKAEGAGECFAAIDGCGTVHSAGFLVWDDRVAYALALGNDTSQRSSGATSLLEWHLIKFAADRSALFDFCGSMLEPVERFVRSFGAVRVPYYRISKFPAWLKAPLAFAGRI